MVATDVDGTIVPMGRTISARTRAALAACQRMGVEVVLVTARPPRWMPPVIEALGFAPSAICANGAITVATGDYRVLDMVTIPADVLTEIMHRLQRVVPDAAFAAETPTVLRAGPGYEDLPAGTSQKEGLVPADRYETILSVSSAAEVIEEQTYKFVVTSGILSADELLEVSRKAVGHLASVTRSVAGRAFVEMGPLGMSKARTLDTYAAGRGIRPAEVVAFGDMPNDLEMLAWAGRGYAMGGSHPEVAAAARFLAPSAVDDGVAHVLEELLANEAQDPSWDVTG